MADYKVITISRQFGSGGHEIGQMISDRLGIPMYDHRLVSMAAEELNVTEEMAGQVDETRLNTFLSGYDVNMSNYPDFINAASYIYGFNDNVYRKQAEIIRGLAKKGPCVIIGRCADYVLRDDYTCVNVFICADRQDRIRRIAERYDLTERKAAAKIRKMDRDRQYYYETHTGLEWGGMYTHQAVLNVSMLGQKQVVDILETMYRRGTEE